MADRKSLDGLRQKVGFGFNARHVGLGTTQLAELTLRRAMAAKKRQILKRAGGRSSQAQVRVAARRFAHNKARALKRRFWITRSWSIPAQHLLEGRISSPILDRLDGARPKLWKPIVARKFKREPDRLSLVGLNFLDDPVGSIALLRRLSELERSAVNAYLDFDDPHVLDVGAYLVVAEFWSQLSKVFHGGRMSRPIQKVLSAIRLDHELGMNFSGVNDHQDVWAFPVRHRRPRGTTQSPTAALRPQDREKVADEFCDLVDDWLHIACEERSLAGNPWELSLEGRSLIAQMTGEILDNAERHSLPNSSDGDWSTTAFMAARETPNGGRELRCFLAFLSVGQSIAESMAKAPAELLAKASPYLNRFSKQVPRETLLTVLALQDAITSDPDARLHRRGGTGLQDVLDLIGELGAAHRATADVRATIVSGQTCIRLRHPILVGQRDLNGRRVQWCNAGNSPLSAPDPSIAFQLPAHFSGTLVSVAFTLDPRHFVTTEVSDGRFDQLG